jgi:hypothetical protein
MHHLKGQNGGKLCRTECLDLTQGGSWDGYLLIGPASHFDENMYCGPKLPLEHSHLGRNEDVH